MFKPASKPKKTAYLCVELTMGRKRERWPFFPLRRKRWKIRIKSQADGKKGGKLALEEVGQTGE